MSGNINNFSFDCVVRNDFIRGGRRNANLTLEIPRNCRNEENFFYSTHFSGQGPGENRESVQWKWPRCSLFVRWRHSSHFPASDSFDSVAGYYNLCSFNGLRRLETYFRNITGQRRRNSLVIICIERAYGIKSLSTVWTRWLTFSDYAMEGRTFSFNTF